MCGRQSRFAELGQPETIEIENLSFNGNRLCTYRIYADPIIASKFGFIQIELEYLFGAQFSVYTGSTLAKAGNETILQPETKETFPASTEEGGINYIYIGIVPYEEVTTGGTAKFNFTMF